MDGRTSKVLILGTAESGKSTICRHIRRIHGDQFTSEEIRFFKHHIRASSLELFASVLQDFIDLSTNEPLNTQLQEYLQEYKTTTNYAYTRNFIEKAVFIWRVYSIQKYIVEIINTPGNISRLVLPKKVHSDNPANHFLPSFSRIMRKGYNPILEDILSVRIPTTGIMIQNFNCVIEVEDIMKRI